MNDRATAVGAALCARHFTLTTAESCTGGWISKTITDIPGSSAWFGCGFVTYSNIAKQHMLGVSPKTLAEHGAVSAEVVLEMAQGALDRSGADVAVAVSGIAGPDGGNADKPVGTVYIAWLLRGGNAHTEHYPFSGDRASVRQQTVHAALAGILAALAKS